MTDSDSSNHDERITDERITAEEARRRLGVSKNKMAEWLSYGLLPSEPSRLDRRVKLVRVSDVEKIEREMPKRMKTKVKKA